MRAEPIKINIGNNGTILYLLCFLDGGRTEVIHNVEKDLPDPLIVQLTVIERIIELRQWWRFVGRLKPWIVRLCRCR